VNDHRERPVYVLQERAVLHVAKDCLVSFETNRYSVPFRLVGKRVEVESVGGLIRIFHQGELVANHPRLLGCYQVQMEKAHYHGIFSRPNPSPAVIFTENSGEVEVRDLSFYERLLEGGGL